MMLLGPLVLIGIVTAVVIAVQRGVRHGEPRQTAAPGDRPAARPERAGTSASLTDSLDRWVAADLLTPEQARAIVDHERSSAGAPAAVAVHPPRERPVRPPRRIPVFAEALGYIGGVLALAGLALIISNAWPDLATSLRLGLSFAVTAALIGGGALVHEHLDPAFARLRWFLWAIAAGTSAVFTAVLMMDVLDVEDDAYVAAACVGAAAFVSGVLWWWRDRPIQELLFIGGTIISLGILVSASVNQGVAGLTVWILAAITLTAGLRHLTPQPIIPHGVGAIALLAGAAMTTAQWMSAGLLFTLATVGMLLLLADLAQVQLGIGRRVILLVVGGFGALQVTPPALVHFAREAGAATGLITWSIGVVVLAVGLRRLLLVPLIAEIVGALGMIGGAALTGAQWPDFAPLFGIATAIGLIVLGMLPGQVVFSLLGSLGLLINVPWAIGRYFPGEGRAPLLILVSGALIIVVAVLLARQGNRIRTELTFRDQSTPEVSTDPSSLEPGERPEARSVRRSSTG